MPRSRYCSTPIASHVTQRCDARKRASSFAFLPISISLSPLSSFPSLFFPEANKFPPRFLLVSSSFRGETLLLFLLVVKSFSSSSSSSPRQRKKHDPFFFSAIIVSFAYGRTVRREGEGREGGVYRRRKSLGSGDDVPLRKSGDE